MMEEGLPRHYVPRNDKKENPRNDKKENTRNDGRGIAASLRSSQ